MMNPYEVVGAEKGATPEEIEAAYKAQSKLRHPDKDGGSEEAFKKLNAAYQILKDPHKRAVYDDLGIMDGDENYAVDIQAYGLIQNCFKDAVLGGGSNGDLLYIVMRMIHTQADAVKSQIANISGAAARFENGIGAIPKKMKAPNAVQQGVMTGLKLGLNEAKTEKLKAEDMLKPITRALELLSGCEWEKAAETIRDPYMYLQTRRYQR